jgi:hypothetical protein
LPSSSSHAAANLKISPRRMLDRNFNRSFNKIYLAIQYNQFGSSVNYHKNYPTAHKSKLHIRNLKLQHKYFKQHTNKLIV